MCNRDSRPTSSSFVQRILYDTFTLSIQRTSRFVEEKDADSEAAKENVIAVSLSIFNKRSELDGDHSKVPLFQKLARYISAINKNNNIVRFSTRLLKLEASFDSGYGRNDNSGIVLYESSDWTKPLLCALPSLEYLVFNSLFKRQKSIECAEDNFYYYRRGLVEGMLSNLARDVGALTESAGVGSR